ncbi:beta-1,3-glucan-binding protein 2 [Tribolium castaneum]|uniref:Gram-negative bacteria-binding protein 3-like Protein n=1 Tax=Tribolium castaneum TaxID=7070 RepID=D2A2V6_TRICA|nr:PREDICTED: beta-1,3-glucan-binding protein 2 [Tribolium castaneum]EFA01998.1 Gram-negative bacteria-binding protein 3-like Protein [Tribolium castaneum]|eukprot:XP_971680.1 PREDICTED: beta-1,3-glucan-binding protein 2 [Tribolium castaneum]
MCVCKTVLLIVGLGGCFAGPVRNYGPLRHYNVPRPSIQAFRPRGFKVSIPHTEGIQLFAFHGNINKPLHGLEAGQFSQDVLQREGDEWVFQDSSAKLNVGDKIYYWLFIIKEDLGYRYDHGEYEVKVLATRDFDSPQTTSVTPNLAPNLGICEKVMVNLTRKLLDLQQEIESLRETNDILEDMVQKHTDTATTLTLDGLMIKDDDELVSVIQAIIKDKLGLKSRIQNVTRQENGMVKFQVASLREKLEVVKAAKRKLKSSSFTITY